MVEETKVTSAETDAPRVSTSSPLAKAEQAAQAHSDSRAVGAATTPCPLRDEKRVIEINVVGEDGMGLDGIDLRITRGDGLVLTGKTGPAGLYRFKGLEPGSYKLSLPELDRDAWLVKSVAALPESEARCTGMASWQTAATPAVVKEQAHIIKQGECVAKIAERYGFFQGTIWDYPANIALKNLRHDKMHILYKDDVVVIPAKRQKEATAATGCRLTLQRHGVPERLRIRFLYYDETPKAGVTYLLSIITDEGSRLADISSDTDGEGFVDQPIPPNAVFATITLDPGCWPVVHKFNLGYMNPIDEVSGWQARLTNLGYHCGTDDNWLGPKTEAAIRAFQRAKGLIESGKRDAPTRAALLAIALS